VVTRELEHVTDVQDIDSCLRIAGIIVGCVRLKMNERLLNACGQKTATPFLEPCFTDLADSPLDNNRNHHLLYIHLCIRVTE
jgi:hypothetical protein